MEKKQLAELTRKYLQGIATAEEERMLHQWYDSLNTDEEETVSAGPQDTEDSMRLSILSNIKDRIKLLPADEPAVLLPAPRSRWWRKLAAAAVLILLATSGYLLLNNNRANTVATTNERQNPVKDQELAPGGSKAVLTLADGSTMALDSAGNGVLARQGVSTISKSGGLLAYNNDNTAPTEVLYNTLTTPHGGRYEMILSDGSRVWLNSVSSLRFPVSFTGKERRVEVTGEAYFEVAKNTSMPFKVVADGMEVEVLGTHFNVMAYADEPAVQTTLLEGKVKAHNATSSILLAKGEQARLNKNGDLNLIRNIDLQQVLAWKNGLFHFNDTNIKEIMRQMERWYDVEIEYRDNMDNLDFGGVFSQKAYATEVLKILEATETVHFEIKGNKIIVMAGKK